MKSFKQFITENSGEDLIIVDIQKAYAKNINFDIFAFSEYITSQPFRKNYIFIMAQN